MVWHAISVRIAPVTGGHDLTYKDMERIRS